MHTCMLMKLYSADITCTTSWAACDLTQGNTVCIAPHGEANWAFKGSQSEETAVKAYKSICEGLHVHL